MGTWTYQDPELGARLPAVENSFNRFRNLLVGPMCGWPEHSVTTIANELDPGRVPDLLMTQFAAAEDVALFYYVGHGLLGSDPEAHLRLSLTGTVVKEPYRIDPTSLPYSAVRSALINSRARAKLVILDCCNSRSALPPTLGTAATAHEDVPEVILDEAGVEQTYVLVAAARKFAYFENESASESPQTIFTKYLADRVERGIDNAEPEVTMDRLYSRLRADLLAGNHTLPAGRGDLGGSYPFCRNAALMTGRIRGGTTSAQLTSGQRSGVGVPVDGGQAPALVNVDTTETLYQVEETARRPGSRSESGSEVRRVVQAAGPPSRAAAAHAASSGPGAERETAYWERVRRYWKDADAAAETGKASAARMKRVSAWGSMRVAVPVVVTGVTGAGKTSLRESLVRGVDLTGDEIGRRSLDVERRKVLIETDAGTVYADTIVIPGTRSAERYAALQDYFGGRRPPSVVVHVVCWGYDEA